MGHQGQGALRAVATDENRWPAGPLWLLAPMTYMNLSGKAVAPLARFFKIEASEIEVVATGKLTLKGRQVEVNGSQDVTIKGGMIKLN